MSELESFNDALIECVKACGGSKTVASIIWPEKTVNDAQRLLLACLNSERNEKLSPEQALLIMRLAKNVGCHVGIEYICQTLGYSKPEPITKQDEAAQIHRDFIEAQKAMMILAKRMELAGLLKGNQT